MVGKVNGSSTPPAAPAEQKQVNQTKEVESTKTDVQTTSSAPEYTRAEAPEYTRKDTTAQRAETSMTGQAKAVELNSKVPSGKPAGATDSETATIGKGPAAPAGEPPLLVKDSVGPHVEKMQTDLNTWRTENGKPPIKVDGTYGTETETAVKDFQKTNGITPDGKAGSITHERLKLENDANFKKLDGAAKQNVRDQMKAYEKEPASRENLKKLATSPEIANLPKDAQLNAMKAYAQTPGETQAKTIQNIASNGNFQKLDEASKNKTFELAAQKGSSPLFMKDLETFSTSDKFQKLSVGDREKALNLFGSTTPSGRASLQKLMDREVNGESALVNKSKDGTTTLDNLDRLSKTPLDSKIVDGSGAPQNKDKVMEDLLGELARPDQTINQDNRGTCTVTSISNRLANQNPGEYARIATDLSTKGESKLANGDKITPPADGFAQDNSNRSVSERLIQSSLMNYARPKDGYQNWNPGADGVRGTPDDGFPDATNPSNKKIDGFPPNGGALGAFDNKRVMEALHNKPFERNTDNLLDRTKKEIDGGHGPVFTGVKWGGGVHAIEVTKIENGRVYYRNPWGPGGVGPTDPPGETGASRVPPRRVEDGPNGVESMTIEDYNARALDIIAEKH